jgi:transposase
MARLLKMATIEAIRGLHERHWSDRRIARELGVDRGTVAKYVRPSPCVPKPAKAPIGSEAVECQTAEGKAKALAAVAASEGSGIEGSVPAPLGDAMAGGPKPAKAPIGSEPKPAKAPIGSEPKPAKAPIGSGPKPAKAPIGSQGGSDAAGLAEASVDPAVEVEAPAAPISSEKECSRSVCEPYPAEASPDPAVAVEAPAAPISSEKECSRSVCEPYRQVILEKLEVGLSAQRIYQDLVQGGFGHRYHSVRRFVARLRGRSPLPFRRLECAAGEEAQVDFGAGAWIELSSGKRQRSHVFRIVLSHSRKGYSEAVHRQTTEDFIRAMENAFWHFGGAPKVLVIDNLKAAVKHPDWYDPELNPKVQSFCAHYGVVILPTKPRTPRHKGKIEAGVDYVQENGLRGHRFTTLEAENDHLVHWETTVADTRIHGTIRKQVGKLFAEVEHAALQPLPLERFPFFHEGQRTVHRDGHVEVAKAYYSVPPEHVGRTLWVRWDLRLVRIFNARMEQIAVHVRQEPGRFSTQGQHIAAEKRNGVERGAVWYLSRARLIGQHTARWAEAMIQARGIEGVRVLQGLWALTKRHDAEAIERACEVAFSHGAYRLRTLRQLLKRDGPKQETFAFLDEHPIIRPLSDYAKLVSTSFTRPWTPGSLSVVYCGSSVSASEEFLP